MTRALLAACLLAVPGVASAGGPATGRLAGTTQISFGCPGPVREDGSGCDPWRPFAGARVSVGGRVVVSDARGRFVLALAPGAYVVRGLPQAHTRGATRVVVRVYAGRTTPVLVRFDGFPQMV